MNVANDIDNDPSDEPTSNREISSGTWIVIAMFAFGTILTTTLFIYWEMHTAPYRPLQQAIVAEFPKSKPRVEGGQRKSHKDSPMTLRVVMSVLFDPNEEKNGLKVNSTIDKVQELADQHHDLSGFDMLHVHLYHTPPEQEISQKSIERELP